MLRNYQKQALDSILGAFAQGKRPLLYLETGAGKTHIFCEILKKCHAKGKRAIMVVRGRQLVDQASRRLDHEGTPHGVLMAGHWRYRLSEPIQVASIDTLISRGVVPEADLIVIDEGHLAVSKGYKDFLMQYDCPVLSVTATPFSPMGHLADTIIRPITFDELVEQGYLCPPRYFAPTMPDLKGVHSNKDDYIQTELAECMDKGNLIGDLVHHYIKLASGRKAVCFAVNIRHSRNICDAFNSAGIPAIHADADSSVEERLGAIEKLRTGEASILCNVGIFNLGVDIPFLDCLILARPTKSINLYRQQLGRGTRPHSGKTDFLVLDHASNVMRHGFINEELPAVLTTETKIPVPKSMVTCLNCFAVFSSSRCPNCGNENEVRFRKIEIKDGELKELRPEDLVKRDIKALKAERKAKGYKRGWIYWAMVRKYGKEYADQHFHRTPDWIKSRLSTQTSKN